MKTPPNIIRETVAHLAQIGCEFYIMIPVVPAAVNKTAPVKISATQLSKSVTFGNRCDQVVVDLKFGRNGRMSATVVEIPSDCPF